MALNPFFLQGSPGEQRLIQDLINEQLKIYGIEVSYIPRKFVKKETIMREIVSSRFDDNFLLEAYILNYEGYAGAGDILTKFGMSLRDELTLIISKERFEDFIAPFLLTMTEEEILASTRPREGDLVYFPLGKRLFEVKFVEHEQPFYQLGKTYVYEIKCELFEYEDEVIDTSDEEIDALIQEKGYITTLNLVGTGRTATAESVLNTGYVKNIYINDDGYGYSKTPTITFSASPLSGGTAKAVAITTSIGGVKSIKDIVFTNAGFGYTVPPTITITGGGGVGAAITCDIERSSYGVIAINVTNGGVGYSTIPSVLIQSPPGIGNTALAISYIGSASTITSINISNPGSGYTTSSPPNVIIGNPSIITGFGNYIFNEVITGLISGTKGRVKSWDASSKKLKVSFVGIDTNNVGFLNGETIVGSSSSATYSVNSYVDYDMYDKYSQNLEIQNQASSIIDFSETNPFGTY